jgi:hypothetical protein
MHKRISVLVSLLASQACLAAPVITESPGRHEARKADNSLIGLYSTHEECVAALPKPTTMTSTRLGTCKYVTHVDGRLDCEGVPKLPLTTFVIFDPNAVKYTFPLCKDGETCVHTYTDEPGVRTLPNGTEYTFTDVGGIRMNEDGTTDEYKLVQNSQATEPSACWKWEWVPFVIPPPAAQNPDDFHYPVAFDPGAFDSEQTGAE